MMVNAIAVPGYVPPDGLLALYWTTFAAAAIFVALRTGIRLRLAGGLGIEDGWIYFALATLLTNTILQTAQLQSIYYIEAVESGLARPDEEFLTQGDVYVKYEFAIIGLFWTVLWCVKASFLSVYYKLFAQQPVYRRLWYGLAVLTFVVYVICWVLSFTTCHPIDDYFTFGACTSPYESYLSRVNVYYSTSVDIATDLMIKINNKQKGGLLVVFGLCAVIIVFAIIRAFQVLGSQNVNIILLSLWSSLESSISVIIGCLPPFKMLLHKASSQRGYSGYQYNVSGSRSKRTHEQPNRSNLHYAGMPLESFNFPRNSARRTDADSSGESQEAIVQAGRQDITIKNDITVKYHASPPDEEPGFRVFSR